MRLISTVALFSITALATQHATWNEGSGHYGYYQPESQPTPEPVIESPPTVHTSVVEYVPPPPTHETSPAAVEEPPMHETSIEVVQETTTVMMHEPVETPVHTPPPTHEAIMEPPAEGPMTHTVTVGGDAGLVYTPSEIKAAVGDLVHFIFHKQNHSVTQSTFDKPCNRLETGDDSGLLPNPNNTVVPAPVWAYTVKEEAPTWWYCKQRTGTHCGKGMVFAINPTVEKTFNMFKEQAIKLNGTAAITTTAPPEKTVTDVATTVTLISEPTVTSPPEGGEQPPATDKPYTTPGWNENGNPSACNCACFCGIGSFPQGDGWGHFGGVGGTLTAPW